jgi:hypothetical protein
MQGDAAPGLPILDVVANPGRRRVAAKDRFSSPAAYHSTVTHVGRKSRSRTKKIRRAYQWWKQAVAEGKLPAIE